MLQVPEAFDALQAVLAAVDVPPHDPDVGLLAPAVICELSSHLT